MKSAVLCSIPGCKKPSKARTWCLMHYKRFHRHGSPHTVLTTPPGAVAAWIAKLMLDDSQALAPEQDCIPWPFARYLNGYGAVKDPYGPGNRVASNLICAMWHGSPEGPNTQAAHSCGKGHEGCVNPHHLRWATPAENAADRVEHGTHNRGERQGSSKLTSAQVVEIRGSPEPDDVLAARMGVSPRNITLIRERVSWAWLE